jgi:hypothetical protein
MTRLTMLFIAVALVLPGAALAMPTNDVSGAQPQATQDLRAPDRDSAGTVLDEHGVDQAAQQRKWTATGRYYASFGATKALPAPADEPAAVATGGNGVGWTLAIGSGIALMLIAGGLGVYAGRTIHPRHIGA